MLGNIITMVQPLQSRFKSTFERKWNKGIAKIRSLSPSDLEEMDSEIKKLKLLCDISNPKTLGEEGNKYIYTLQRLKSDHSEIILNKFKTSLKKMDVMMGNPEIVKDAESESKRFDEALGHFRMAKALFHRWKLDSNNYVSGSNKFDCSGAMKGASYRMARKRKLLMEEKVSRKKIIEYSAKTKILGDIDGEISSILGWYEKTFLNIQGNNSKWVSKSFTQPYSQLIKSWMPVDFIDASDHVAPLEMFRKIPSDSDVKQLRMSIKHFVDFYFKNDFVSMCELEKLDDYEALLEHSASFVLDSDNPESRLKSVLFDKLLSLHRVLDDASSRQLLYDEKKSELGRSFLIYSAPIEELYKIFTRGYISSKDSMRTIVSGDSRRGLSFELNSSIRNGELGFVFPLTQVVDGKKFLQISSDGVDEIYVFENYTSDNPESAINIDITKGFFFAPKQGYSDYFTKLFMSLAKQDNWFDPSRLDGWMKRHCFFYDESDREELLNLLKDNSFTKVFSAFSKKTRDNLSLDQRQGELKLSDDFVILDFDSLDNVGLGGNVERLAVSLFEWN